MGKELSHEMKFNLQEALHQMRMEQKEDHEALCLKVDTGFSEFKWSLATHDKRIGVVENFHKTTRWLVGAVVVAILAFLADLAVQLFA